MALQVACLLDAACAKPEWADSATTSANAVLDSIVAPEAVNVMVTIAGRSYVLATTSKNKLSFSVAGAGAETTKALAKADARLIVETDAVSQQAKYGSDWVPAMERERKIRVEGDPDAFIAVDKLLTGLFEKVKSMISSSGVSEAAVNASIQQANAEAELAVVPKPDIDEMREMEVAMMKPEGEDPAFGWNVTGWILFTALTTMTGNMGQSNYAAANIILDVMTYNRRIQGGPITHPIAWMWGAVGGLGMRWKAFASQDFLQDESAVGTRILMTPMEAQSCIRHACQLVAPEWVGCNLVSLFQLGVKEGGNTDPWGFGKNKGKGGGVSFEPQEDDEADYDVSRIEALKSEQHLEKSPFYVGRRVKTHGLTNNADLNEVKGTILEEVGSGVWKVHLDEEMGDHLLREANMKTLVGSMVSKAVQKASAVKEQSTQPVQVQPFCIAGTWSDWVPQDMKWDASQMCFTHEVELTMDDVGKFGICQGVSTGARWKKRPAKQWIIGKKGGRHLIRLYLKEDKRSPSNVDWVELK